MRRKTRKFYESTVRLIKNFKDLNSFEACVMIMFMLMVDTAGFAICGILTTHKSLPD